MALFPIHDFFVFNQQVESVSEFVPSENDGGIYEVIRVVHGIPLFLDEHLKRFYETGRIAGKKLRFSEAQIDHLLKMLIKKNKADDGNVLISIKNNLKMFFIPHNYPETILYSQGVNCGILEAERKNPNAKIFQSSVRLKANKMIAEEGIYEVMLLDGNGRITEGSRSNVFFIQGDKISTPPAEEVLLGITRQKTILCAKKLGFKIHQEEIFARQLTDFDAVFITGTSPKILPVRMIGSLSFDPQNRIVQELIKQYDLLISEYITPRMVSN